MSNHWSFEYLWNIQADHIDDVNRRKHGWSAVSCISLKGEQDKRFFLKRQENYFSKNLRHPFRGELTLVNEHRILSFLQAHGVGTPTIAFFSSQYSANQARAILMTENLTDYHDLEYYLSHTDKFGVTERYQLIKSIALEVRKMHTAGVQSRSLYPKHIFIFKNQAEQAVLPFKIAMIDLEKSRFMGFKPWGFLRDLITLNSRTDQVELKHRVYFFKAYWGGRKLSWWQRYLMSLIAKYSA